MRKQIHLFTAVITAALFLFTRSPLAQEEPAGPTEMPPARSIPGITTEDQFPNACVDCHTNYAEANMDKRLSTIMEPWGDEVEPAVLAAAQAVMGPDFEPMGAHPPLDVAGMSIPEECMLCHEDGDSEAIPFAPLVHKIHLAGGNDSIFLRVFQGECTHCHKLAQETGQWRVPSGLEK